MVNRQQNGNHFLFSPAIIAHRGASAIAPENTRAAFLEAKRLGFSWIECDVMLSSTGEVVVMHDDTLDRTTNGHGRVVDCPYSTLKTLDAGSWFDPVFSMECILTFEELLLLLSEQSLSANIELKPLQGYEEETVKRAMAILHAFQKPIPSILLSSFSKKALRMVRAIDTDVSLGLLMNEWEEGWAEDAAALSCATIHVNQAVLTLKRIQQIESAGYGLLVYTVNDVSRAKELLAQGVDAVFSDCPREIANVFGIQ